MHKFRYLIFAIDLGVLLLLGLPLGNPPALTLVLPILMMIGIYAFRSFDQEVLGSGRTTLSRAFWGSLFGLIPFYLSYPFIGSGIRVYTIPYSIITGALSVTIIHRIAYRFLLKSLPTTKLLLLGSTDGLYPILENIVREALDKLEFHQPRASRSGRTADPNGGYDGVVMLDPEVKPQDSYELSRRKTGGAAIYYLPMLCETYLKRIPIEVVQRNPSYYSLAFEGTKDEPLTRFIDVTVSILLLILLSPALLLAALLIMLEDGTPIRLKQTRIGRYGVPFVIQKLRTLRDTEINARNPNIDIEERILRVGKFLRKTRLDEVLNFVNVIKGEMSIVGPRPEMQQFHLSAQKSIPFYVYRLRVKPGITGWAQLTFKHTSTMDDYKLKTEYDLYYIKNRSIFLDLKIMMKTFETMIGLKGR